MTRSAVRWVAGLGAPRPALLAMVAALTGCARQAVVLQPAAPATFQPAGYLQAGFGVADITPDLSRHRVGMAGYGPDGRRATGVRERLLARALVLEDARGERLALVTVELPIMAIRVHRDVADTLAARGVAVSADRLIISATHTHAGPGRISDAAYYNQLSSSVAGYDAALSAFMVTRISDAVIAATRDLRRARIGWGVVPLWGFTWNRSYGAFQRNGAQTPWWNSAPPATSPEERAVDPHWLMLRVDALEGGTWRPRGAWSLFAAHGTVVPNVNTELDPDFPGDVARALERRLDASLGAAAPWRAVMPLAQGTEGDATAISRTGTHCGPPVLRPGPRAPGPRAGDPAPAFQDARRSRIRACVQEAEDWSRRQAELLADGVMRAFTTITVTDQVEIARDFRVMPLKGGLAHPLLCDLPIVGISQPSGSAEDGMSRLYGFRFLGRLGRPIGWLFGSPALGARLGEGGDAEGPPDGCHAEKRPVGGVLQPFLARMGGAPDIAQLSLIRIHDVVLATLPAEITTMTGVLMRDSIRAGLGAAAAGLRHIGIVALTNGYMQYVTTRAEYSAQDYEGGSNLYGPRTAEVLARELGAMRPVTGPVPVPAVRVWP